MRASTFEHERSTLQSQASQKIAKLLHRARSNENAKAKEVDSASKLVTAVESLATLIVRRYNCLKGLNQLCISFACQYNHS